MSDTEKKTDDQKFKETLKRMLETPPDPKSGKAKDKANVDNQRESSKSTRHSND